MLVPRTGGVPVSTLIHTPRDQTSALAEYFATITITTAAQRLRAVGPRWHKLAARAATVGVEQSVGNAASELLLNIERPSEATLRRRDGENRIVSPHVPAPLYTGDRVTPLSWRSRRLGTLAAEEP